MLFCIKVLLAKKISCYKAEELRCKEFKCYNTRLHLFWGELDA